MAASTIRYVSDDNERYNLVCVDTTSTKALLRQRAMDIRNVHLRHIIDEIRDEVMDICDEYDILLERLMEVPTDETEFGKLVKCIDESKTSLIELQQRTDLVHEKQMVTFEQFHDFAISIDDMKYGAQRNIRLESTMQLRKPWHLYGPKRHV